MSPLLVWLVGIGFVISALWSFYVLLFIADAHRQIFP